MAPSRFVDYPNRLLNMFDPVQTASCRKSQGSGNSSFKIDALTWAVLLASFALYVMINYLTNVWNLSITHAAGIINIWYGITPALAIVFTFLGDSFNGHYHMLVLSSIAYSIGFGLLFLSTPPIFGSCSEYKEECIGNIQKALFFTSFTLIAVGWAGTNFSNIQFGSEGEGGGGAEARVVDGAEARVVAGAEVVCGGEGEGEGTEGEGTEGEGEGGGGGGGGAEARVVDGAEARVVVGAEVVCGGESVGEGEGESEGRGGGGAESVFYDIIYCLITFGLIIAGSIALPYIKPWSIRFGIPAICTLIATGLFLNGSTQYRINEPDGCPLTIGLRVFVAAASKYFQQVSNFIPPVFTNDDDDAHFTNSLRCLDKAANKFPDQARSKSWTLCSVREVEDTKTGIRKVPLWLTFIAIGLVGSLGYTYFLEQANHMDLKLGTIKVPIPVFLLLYYIFRLISVNIYILLKKYFPRKYVSRIGIAIGMLMSVLCCIIAAIVETRRLHVLRDHGLLNNPNERAPMSVFFLLPQFVLLAAADEIADVGIQDLLMNQVPKSMYSYMICFRDVAAGLGAMGNVLLVYIVGKLSARNNNQSWFQHTSNKSRLDRYYWILAGLSTVNLIIYTIVACYYKYKSDDNELEGGES